MPLPSPTRRALVTLGVALLAAGCTGGRSGPGAGDASPAQAPYDLLVVNARIVDGTGSPWYLGDLGVRGDRIADVAPAGTLARRPSRRAVDARGLVLAPGFIDMLGHSELSILRGRNRFALSKVSQGITSEITGEVASAWPVPESPRPGQGRGDSADWRSLGEYFARLERTGVAINLGTYVGAESVRRAVMGDESRRPTPAELARMEGLVDSAMRDGALGFSTGLIYAPTTWFTTEELVVLARRAARHGGGYASHIRNEGPQLLPAIREAIRIGAEAGTWIQIRHLKASGEENWGRVRDAVALIDSARAAGVDVSADVYPYVASGTGLSAILPSWMQAGGNDSMLVRLRDPAVRARLRAARDTARGTRPPERVMVNAVRADSLVRYEGKRLDEVGRMRGQDPWEAAYDLLLADRGGTSAIYFTMHEDDLRAGLRAPWVSIGQDAGAVTPDSAAPGSVGRGRGHPRAFGSFPRVLGRYARDERLFPLEEAVRKMTALPAARVGLADRGVLKAGMFADLVLFDPRTIRDEATFEHPQRLATGIRWVVVNGVPVVADGAPTWATPGRALRRR